MTTELSIYKTALEHIRDGSDVVCTECGLVGRRSSWVSQSPWWVRLFRRCPLCGGRTVKAAMPREIAAYALAQGGRRGENSHADLHCHLDRENVLWG